MIRSCFIAMLSFIIANAYICSEESWNDAYNAHLVLKNYADALAIIDCHLQQNPQSGELLEAKILCLAYLGQESDMLKTLDSLACLEPTRPISDHLLEEISWAVLQQASVSTAPEIRFEALVAAFYSQEAMAAPIIKKGLHDPETSVRALAFHAASQYRDAIFFEDAVKAIGSDPSQQVRCNAIVVLGSNHTLQAKEILMGILADAERSTDEKICAMNTLCCFMHMQDADMVRTLLDSESSALRTLGWRLVAQHPELAPQDAYFQKQEFAEDALLEKIAASARVGTYDAHAFLSLLQSQNFRIQSLAAWYFLLKGDKDQVQAAQQVLEIKLHAPQDEALLAASILAHAGTKGIFLAQKYHSDHKDPYVRITLSLGLLRERSGVAGAAQVVKSTLAELQERIDTQTFLYFDFIAPSRQNRIAWIPGYPETKDLLTRLELFSILAACDDTVSKDELAQFLKNKSWGVVFQVSGVLLEEWPEQAKETLRQLLEHKDKEIRLQAAIILAFTYQDEAAEKILYDSYPDASRTLKEEILLAIGVIGSRNSIAFLIKALHEPSQKLRIRAASCLQRCIRK